MDEMTKFIKMQHQAAEHQELDIELMERIPDAILKGLTEMSGQGRYKDIMRIVEQEIFKVVFSRDITVRAAASYLGLHHSTLGHKTEKHGLYKIGKEWRGI